MTTMTTMTMDLNPFPKELVRQTNDDCDCRRLAETSTTINKCVSKVSDDFCTVYRLTFLLKKRHSTMQKWNFAKPI